MMSQVPIPHQLPQTPQATKRIGVIGKDVESQVRTKAVSIASARRSPYVDEGDVNKAWEKVRSRLGGPARGIAPLLTALGGVTIAQAFNPSIPTPANWLIGAFGFLLWIVVAALLLK